MYTIKEVAAKLGSSYSHVRLLVERGRLRAINIGCGKQSAWRIAESDLVDFLDSRRNKADDRQDGIDSVRGAK